MLVSKDGWVVRASKSKQEWGNGGEGRFDSFGAPNADDVHTALEATCRWWAFRLTWLALSGEANVAGWAVGEPVLL